jgi:hypothetical protein
MRFEANGGTISNLRSMRHTLQIGDLRQEDMHMKALMLFLLSISVGVTFA